MLSGCASRPSARGGESLGWQGRLSVTVQTDPIQTNSAQFQLLGDEETGELVLFSPLGTTLAQIQWQAGLVHLHEGSNSQRFGSMAQLTRELTGAELPVAALFDWLKGRPHEVSGWAVDLSGLPTGALVARRAQPQPLVTLRIQLEP